MPIPAILFLLNLIFLCPLLTLGQTQPAYRLNNYYDAAIAPGNAQFSGEVSWSHLKGFGKKKQRFKLGYGIRFTAYYGKDKNFITAPARLTSRQEGPQVLFSKTYNENLDTVRFAHSRINSLNAVIHLGYSFSGRFDIGFNIDAIGFSFGPRKQGELKSSIKPAHLSTKQSGKPTSFNLLLVSDNDIGSLNSALFLRYWIKDKIAVKAGFCYYFAEYTTDNKLVFNNDRFRNKVSMVLAGITYNPFKIITD